MARSRIGVPREDSQAERLGDLLGVCLLGSHDESDSARVVGWRIRAELVAHPVTVLKPFGYLTLHERRLLAIFICSSPYRSMLTISRKLLRW